MSLSTALPLKPLSNQSTQRICIVITWMAMLVFSILPEVFLIEFYGGAPAWIIWAKTAILGIILAASLLWPPARPLWRYLVILLVILAGQQFLSWLSANPSWQGGLDRIRSPFMRDLLGGQVAKFGLNILLILALLALGFRRKDIFLVRGNMDAPSAPVRWLGFPDPEPWKRYGAKWSVFFAIGMVVILSFFGQMGPAPFVQALPLLPAVLFFAVTNAFNEELTYRSAVLGPLEPQVGARQALYASAVLFGIGHFYGVPYGVAGVLLSTFMGWFLGKSMLETRGFFWPWFLHVVLDICIFYFIAAGSVIPGGGR